MKRLIQITFVSAAFLLSFTTPLGHGDDLMKPMMDMMDKMKKMKLAGNFDQNFANMMVEHHQGAIDMSQVYLKSGKNEKLKSMAQEGISKQKEEQKKLKKFTGNSGSSEGSASSLMAKMDEMMQKMHSHKMSGDIDKDFANMMIMHHEGGLALAKQEVSEGEEKELKDMSSRMIEDQQKDISKLKEFTNK